MGRFNKLQRLAGHKNIIQMLRYSISVKENKTPSLKESVMAEPASLCDGADEEIKQKKTVLIYAGALDRNGMTTSLIHLLSHLDYSKVKCIVVYNAFKVELNSDKFNQIQSPVEYLPLKYIHATWSELFAKIIFYGFKKDNKWVSRKLSRMYGRNFKEYFGKLHVDAAVQFTGYDREAMLLFAKAPCKKSIYVHNDKYFEAMVQKNEDIRVLRKCYRSYDSIALVTEDMREPLLKLGNFNDKCHVVGNYHDAEAVRHKSTFAPQFDKETKSNSNLEKILKELEKASEVFVTIGRFEEQKAHDLLIHAFFEYQKTNKDARLLIIGGYGRLYEATKNLVAQLDLENKVFLICNVSNPMPFLKKADLFILPSRYEGQGLVLFEAISLGIPVVSTDIPGPRGFMREYGGKLIEGNKEAIEESMERFHSGEDFHVSIDFDQYNKECIRQFESLL